MQKAKKKYDKCLKVWARFNKHLLKNTNKAMSLKEIKKFLSVQTSFKRDISHSNSYKLNNTIGEINEEKYIKLINNTYNDKYYNT